MQSLLSLESGVGFIENESMSNNTLSVIERTLNLLKTNRNIKKKLLIKPKATQKIEHDLSLIFFVPELVSQ